MHNKTIFLLLLIFIGCQRSKSPETEIVKSNDQTVTTKVFNWKGTWQYVDNGPIEYVLQVGEMQDGMFPCTYTVTGQQTYYQLSCLGLEKENRFEIYFQNATDGTFLAESQINRDKPALTLISSNGKVITQWDQFFNNFAEEGNKSGSVCFSK